MRPFAHYSLLHNPLFLFTRPLFPNGSPTFSCFYFCMLTGFHHQQERCRRTAPPACKSAACMRSLSSRAAGPRPRSGSSRTPRSCCSASPRWPCRRTRYKTRDFGCDSKVEACLNTHAYSYNCDVFFFPFLFLAQSMMVMIVETVLALVSIDAEVTLALEAKIVPLAVAVFVRGCKGL